MSPSEGLALVSGAASLTPIQVPGVMGGHLQQLSHTHSADFQDFIHDVSNDDWGCSNVGPQVAIDERHLSSTGFCPQELLRDH